MKTLLLTLSLLLATLTSVQARANCAMEQTLCDAQCSIEHFGDKAARLGCESRCAAERAACSTKAGAEKAVELGKKALRDTGAFIEGFTGDKEKQE